MLNGRTGRCTSAFEPPVPCGTPDFESGTFDHSATSPIRVSGRSIFYCYSFVTLFVRLDQQPKPKNSSRYRFTRKSPPRRRPIRKAAVAGN